MKKEPPDFNKWHNSYIFCVKENSGDPQISDDTVQYTYGFSIAPESQLLEEEYRLLSRAIRKEDENFLFNYFASPGLKEIRVQDNGSPDSYDCLSIELQLYYSGEKWGVIYDFGIEIWNSEKRHYEGDSPHDLFYFLPEQPFLLADALTLFNALSFENTTHLIKLHQMWNRLRKISNIAFSFPKIKDEDSVKMFIPNSEVVLKKISKKNIFLLINEVNHFQRDYLIKREVFFDEDKEMKQMRREKKMFSYGYKNAFENYLGKILGSYVYFLQQNNIIKECEYCGNVFEFEKNKSYCSLRDGRDCGKTVRNKRFYQKHRELLLPKARQTTLELRQCYKEHGIKK